MPVIRFDSVPEPLKLPNDIYFGEVTGVAVNSKGHIFVLSRGNGPAYAAATAQLLEFDGDGNFRREIRIDVPVPADAQPAIGAIPDLAKLEATGSSLTQTPGAPWTVCITPGPNQVLYTSDAYPGRIYKLSLDGKVLGVLGESGKQLKQFGWIHEIACPSENVLYVGELLSWRVQKLVLHP